MARGKGILRKVCFCFICKQNFKSTREDATTCSAKCRKAKNRLLGNRGTGEKKKDAVTNQPNARHDVFLNGKWIATKPSREEAERVMFYWMEDWDGEFEVRPLTPKRRAKT